MVLAQFSARAEANSHGHCQQELPGCCACRLANRAQVYSSASLTLKASGRVRLAEKCTMHSHRQSMLGLGASVQPLLRELMVPTLRSAQVVNAPMWFFDTTPAGRILNRFARVGRLTLFTVIASATHVPAKNLWRLASRQPGMRVCFTACQACACALWHARHARVIDLAASVLELSPRFHKQCVNTTSTSVMWTGVRP